MFSSLSTAGNVGVGNNAPMYSSQTQDYLSGADPISSALTPSAYAGAYSTPGQVLGTSSQMSSTPQMSSKIGGTDPLTGQVNTVAPSTPPPSNYFNGTGGNVQQLSGAAKGYSDANQADINRSYQALQDAYAKQNQWNNAISSAYQPGIDQINDYIGKLPGQQQTIQNQLNTDQTNQISDITNQANLSKGNIANQQTQYEQQAQSAWDQANANYNYGRQNVIGQYGGAESGSAGPEMERQMQIIQAQRFGQLQNQRVLAEQQFNQASQGVDSQLLDAHTKLSQQYGDAIVQLQDEFTQRQQALQQAVFQTQAEKTNAQISLLQQTIANAQSISANFNAAKLQLGAVAAQTYAYYSAKGFQGPDFSQFFQGLQGLTQAPSFSQVSQPTDNAVNNIVGNLYGNDANPDLKKQLGIQ